MPGTPTHDPEQEKQERELNFWERLYVPELFKGLGYSFRKISQEPTYTQQYPEEQWYPPDVYRGRPVLVEEDDRPRCVSCNLCARACPPLAISMQSEEVENPKEREPEWFEINMLRCIYCGFCEEVCPEEAIVMSKEYDLTFQSRDEAIFGLERLLQPKDQLEDRLEWLEQYKDPQFGQHWDFQRENNIHSLKDQPFAAWLAEQDLEALGAPLEESSVQQEPATAGEQDWGGPRQGPPATEHAAR